ncbi:MAG: NUDIX domain-containing protein [Candidatus Kapabacteria bacterium]|nr:NUDIX domain-containing protein [Candidatus Kapabacteria bacterium]
MKFVANTIQAHVARYNKSSERFEHLILQRADNEKIYPSIWQVVTGMIDGDETAIAAAIREFSEETGLNFQRMWAIPYLTSFFNHRNNSVSFAPVFGFIVDYNDEVILSCEHQDYSWLELDSALSRLILPSHRDAAIVFEKNILLSDDPDLFIIKF